MLLEHRLILEYLLKLGKSQFSYFQNGLSCHSEYSVKTILVFKSSMRVSSNSISDFPNLLSKTGNIKLNSIGICNEVRIIGRHVSVTLFLL